MKSLILLSVILLLNSQLAYAEAWPKWTMKFHGSGWEVREVQDSELIRIAQNKIHDVGIFISGKKFSGDVEQLLSAIRSTPGVPDREKYELIEINGTRAVQLISAITQNGGTVGVWALMFVQNNSIIALQGAYQNEAGKSFLKQTMESFEFIN